MVKHTQTIRLSVFDHFVGLVLKGLNYTKRIKLVESIERASCIFLNVYLKIHF